MFITTTYLFIYLFISRIVLTPAHGVTSLASRVTSFFVSALIASSSLSSAKKNEIPFTQIEHVVALIP